jgi:hypothetical protein
VYNPCKLVTTDEAGAAFAGETFTNEKGIGQAIAHCYYRSGPTELDIEANLAQGETSTRVFKDTHPTATPVAGLGDEAYVDKVAGDIMVRRGTRWFEISITRHEGGLPNADVTLRGLARLALARV